MKNAKFLVAVLAMVIAVSSCQKNDVPVFEENISTEVLDQINALGFSSQNVIKSEEGYIVEGDIFLTDAALTELAEDVKLRVGEEEHYRTFNLVTATPRVITVSLAKKMPSNFGAALDEALARYNNLNLQITFQRVASNGDITIMEGPKWWNRYGILGMGGFPTVDGDPYHKVEMNTGAFRKAKIGYLATVLAHEIGHNIGFRHTDYMDRSYSCGGAYDNEGASEYGAVHISGTPVNPEQRSWMLSCSDGSDRPFTANDEAALEYLY